MTAAVVKVASVNVTAQKNIFGENLIERFAKFAGVSESSRVTYSKALKQMFRYFADNGISNPTRDNLVEWIDGMKAAQKSASTINLYLTAAKIFFRWLAQEGIFPNIADHIKSGIKPSHAHKKDALDAEQCAALVAGVKGNTIKDLRDRAILSLMGLRHSVATNLIFAGVELPQVQMVLRHKSLSTTMIYAAAWNRYNNDAEQTLSNMIFKE